MTSSTVFLTMLYILQNAHFCWSNAPQRGSFRAYTHSAKLWSYFPKPLLNYICYATAAVSWSREKNMAAPMAWNCNNNSDRIAWPLILFLIYRFNPFTASQSTLSLSMNNLVHSMKTTKRGKEKKPFWTQFVRVWKTRQFLVVEVAICSSSLCLDLI